jgi:hypothetical protein
MEKKDSDSSEEDEFAAGNKKD